MEYKKLSMGGYNLHLIKTDKFKMCHVEVVLRNNFEADSITKRQFLTKILCESNMNYPTRRKLLLRFEDLYNSNLYAFTSRVGASFITNFCIDFLDPSYTEKDIPKDSINLLFDVIFNPLVRNKGFDDKTFEIVKARIRDNINALSENPSRLACNNAIKALGETPAAYSVFGTIKELEEITPESLYDYYLKMIKSDYVDIFVVGNLDMDEVASLINQQAKFDVIKTHSVDMYSIIPKMKEKNITENNNSLQTNIVMLLNFKNLTDYEKNYTAPLYNMILGGGGLQTKLYKKLRGENSLCYTVSSFYQKYDNLIMIHTGVDINKSDKAIKLIKSCISDMVNNISEEEFESAKKTIISSLSAINDSPERIANNYYFQSIGVLDNLDERLKNFKEIKLNDVYNLSKKVSPLVIYTLTGGFE